MKLTFRLKLFLYFVVIILITSIPTALITYAHIYNSLKDNLISNTQAKMIQIDNNFSNMFREIKDNNLFLATSPDIKKVDESLVPIFNMSNDKSSKKYSKEISGLESIIYNQLEIYGTTHPETAYAYVGTKWGGYIQWPDELSNNKFDPRGRPWYIQALANPDKVAISVPYISADESNAAIISASSSIKNTSGEVVGVVGIDVSLEKLSEMVRNIKIGENGYIFMFLDDGTILAHPNANLNFRYISELSQSEHSPAGARNSLYDSSEDYHKFIDIKSGDFETFIDGAPVLVNVYTSPDTGWKMASIIQKSELSSKANKLGYLIALITFLVLLFVIGLTFIVTKKITKPIRELTPLMRAAGNGELSIKANINTNDEFGELGNSFNLMLGKLSSNYEELSAMNEELIATEEELRSQYDTLLYNEEILRNSEERYRIALECANDSIWQWNLVTGEFFTSDKLYEIAGYRPDTRVNIIKFIKNLIHPDDLGMAKKDLKNHFNNITKIYQSEYRIKNSQGVYIWISTRGKIMRDSKDKAIIFAGSTSDISESKIAEDKIKFMAYYDVLTKLANRTLLTDRLNNELELSKSKSAEGAVFFIDLDNFKNINDTMGHNFGDKLLIYLAEQFRSLTVEKDTICRLGGDEFILLHPYSQKSEIETYINKLLTLFNTPFQIDNKQIYITASIGVALYPKDGTDTNTILKNADSAMYKAKELGKNRFTLFDPEMYWRLERKTCIERILRTAIDNSELTINYQPQYSAQENEIFGFEALLRLNSKELGFISPAEFIPIAEECGCITQFSLWVINESCLQSVKWFNAGYKFKSISINISSVDLLQPDLLDNIEKIIKSTSINPNIVELEITETVLMQSLDSSIDILKKLMDMGIRIALDDFGTGYSSLNYLRKIPINTLKIDKSFIDNITSDKKEESIIKNIIRMAHSMDLKVVAEGVETEEQLEILKKRKCDYIQGYYFSKPLPANRIEKLLAQEERDREK
jgi:diguanylate cyclase (GGDEF)-like protein/PAS domain S-box-containing protein